MSETTMVNIRSAGSLADLAVYNKYDGTVLAHLPQSTKEDVERELKRAAAASISAAAMPRHERAQILDTAADLLKQRADKAANLIVFEAGKTIRQARKEVSRAINTLKLSAAESRRSRCPGWPTDALCSRNCA